MAFICFFPPSRARQNEVWASVVLEGIRSWGLHGLAQCSHQSSLHQGPLGAGETTNSCTTRASDSVSGEFSDDAGATDPASYLEKHTCVSSS